MSELYKEALEDAWNTGRNFVDEMVEQWKNDGKISDDLNNDYSGGDSYHHENHVDKSYDLTEAAAILDEFSDQEETDSGLWEGLQPREAISAQAAYTYGNAVYDLWRQHVVEHLNEKLEELADGLADARIDAKETEDADDDQEERLHTAGEWLIRFVVMIGEGLDDADSAERSLLKAALDGLEDGESTPAAAYADWCKENGKEWRGKEIHKILGINPEVKS